MKTFHPRIESQVGDSRETIDRAKGMESLSMKLDDDRVKLSLYFDSFSENFDFIDLKGQILNILV